ncbi:hypothetical protein Poli38472_003183 [Pythium oligandrum]|uniref:Autophagy protein ATG17-like domain-containing protein n=1 Tax=Pythium oligandrum TaxID=41045 RepID=A0A8K1C6C7_PYTOL|nr:hypothetical protein Poli38472_003183 [Pythium oligandrum]|eukprot:TMW57258.1 hypothetical protein Poli38472_003183 [Pythium oligandrum]
MAQHVTAGYFVGAVRDVTHTITEKCQVLKTLLESSEAKFRVLEHTAHTKVFQETPLIDEMDRVFQQLRMSSVSRSFSANESTGATLFDYVDAETVQSLQHDALEQTKEIEEMLGMHRHALTRIAAIYQYFSSFEKRYAEQIHRIRHSTEEQAASLDSKTLEQLYDTAVRFFVDMEQCDRFLVGYFSTINDVNPHYELAIAEAETLFDELRSLREFYRHFVASYAQVGPELERRRRHEARVSKLIAETMNKLHALEQEEREARMTFANVHARFLPSSLCPELKDLPPQFAIVQVENHPPRESA